MNVRSEGQKQRKEYTKSKVTGLQGQFQGVKKLYAVHNQTEQVFSVTAGQSFHILYIHSRHHILPFPTSLHTVPNSQFPILSSYPFFRLFPISHLLILHRTKYTPRAVIVRVGIIRVSPNNVFYFSNIVYT